MNTQILIIGIGYAKGSGKDTLASLLLNHVPFSHRFSPTRVAFADALKAEFAGLFDVTVEEIEARKPLWRGGLQWYGTEYVQQILGDKLYWVKRVEKRLPYLVSAGHRAVIIPDTRFRHECEFIKSAGGVLVKVNRGNDRKDTHASECDLKDFTGWDYVIDNNGSMTQFNSKAVQLAEELLNK